MTWHDTLEGLKQELAEVRAERERRVAAEDAELQSERDEITQMVQTLGVDELLTQLNASLLDGKGAMETIINWESGDEEPDLAGDDDDTDVVTTILSWEEGGDMKIIVDVGMSDDGIYLQINDIEVRLEREALEQGLVEAFRDELEL